MPGDAYNIQLPPAESSQFRVSHVYRSRRSPSQALSRTRRPASRPLACKREAPVVSLASALHLDLLAPTTTTITTATAHFQPDNALIALLCPLSTRGRSHNRPRLQPAADSTSLQIQARTSPRRCLIFPHGFHHLTTAVSSRPPRPASASGGLSPPSARRPPTTALPQARGGCQRATSRPASPRSQPLPGGGN